METGDLRHALDHDVSCDDPKMNQGMRLKILYQVARAIDYLHTLVPGFRYHVFNL